MESSDIHKYMAACAAPDRYSKLKLFKQQCSAISWKLLLTIFDDAELPF